MSPLVKIQNLSYTYHTPKGETKTLENINLMINKGEFISIVGPSGCGKSTLLSVISSLIQPSIGEVVLDKSLINNDSHYIGYMLQKDHLFEWRTVYRNVLLGLEINNKLTTENLEYIDNLLKQYGLHNFKNYKPSQLSGGMRQRAALIRTLALKPEILLLDEPFAALDYQTRLSAGDEIGTIIKKENKTALLVTHDIAEAIFIKKLLIKLLFLKCSHLIKRP
ncbi:ABC transporter ATP-binding protein [Vallitalea maricola]|uniref:ABC transporter ATP-binding protein n=1 Tax=Vallitalea maricola TaxID=3074433 RepID=A0ACB5UH17_9FIRM|nr:ABC transporter ATP-binding protein [Vallitalea sp. AN17-2]